MFTRASLSLVLLAAAPLWSQVDSSAAQPAATGFVDSNEQTVTPDSDQRMLTPTPVAGEGYSLAFTSETRANYLRGGLIFTTAYGSNTLGGSRPVDELSYSVWPTIALDQSRSRLQWDLSYTPGYTFYQKTTSFNAPDQNFAINFRYRLSPHVTLSLRDSFEKTTSALNQPNLGAGSVSGGALGPNESVIAPLANLFRNIGNAELTYQFGPNALVGASGTFFNLHYLNQAQVPGLADSSSRAGSAFYTHRLSGKHYIGATYQYQMLLSYPTQGQNQTQTQGILFFYTLYLQKTLSLSFFGGPEYSDTEQKGLSALRAWSPAAGASLGWQAPHTSFAVSYSRVISGGGGLGGAVHSNSASASARQQFGPSWSAALGASYASNNVLDSGIPSPNTGGHTLTGNVSLQRSFGPHLNLEIGYVRLHQSYSNIAAISAPNQNRVSLSVSYRFERPLGR